jgi:hypothetical protein
MTEFPALRSALVAAAARRRRRRLMTGAAVPAFAVAAGVAAVISFPAASPEREQAAPAPLGALEQAYAVFRRPQTREDALPSARQIEGTVDRARSRLVARDGRVRLYAVPSEIDGVVSLCVLLTGGSVTTAGCGPVARAIRGDQAPVLSLGRRLAALLPDGSRDFWVINDDGTRRTYAVHDNAVLAPATRGLIVGAAWTSAGDTRFVIFPGLVPEAKRPPSTCPGRLDPLPADAAALARRAALRAVDEAYPQAREARVARTRKTAADGTPCPAAVSSRSMEVWLDLVPRDRKRANLPQGRLLAGMVGGRMTVYYLLD